MVPASQILPFVAIFVYIFSSVSGDVYLHVPRGSNNRLNEKSAQRKNANRMFNSENNNRGGYNVGDAGSNAATKAENQYLMKYFQSGPWKTLSNDKGKSKLRIEWTNQHGCGGNEDDSPQKQNCAIVMQYMCQDEDDSDIDSKDVIRNGVKTDRQEYTEANKNNVNNNRKNGNVKSDRGLHETWDWYNKCYLRERNKGLFTADQKLANNGLGYSSAVYTRQNSAGTRYGYECQEEKDYFPYWHPTPWTDVAVLAENSSMCSQYKSKSFNVQPYGECVEGSKGWSRYNNKEECEKEGGEWYLLYNYLEKAKDKKSKNACERTKTSGLQYKWAIPYDSDNHNEECLVMLDKPDCMEAPWSRSNHLGNGENGLPLSYTWTLPFFPSGKTKRCVFRIRYNISTDDYDPYHTDYRQNDDFPVKSPIRQNPYISVMKGLPLLRLAINTAQYGRVFQDRSHAFLLRKRPNGLSQDRIFNVNVRGKRGNIVQVYPAVEYDFAPNQLDVKANDLVHFQWTGSNTHNNGNPAGDGQAGSAGEGKEGTDRNNLVELSDRSGNFPTPFENTKLWNAVKVEWIYHGKKNVEPRDLAINMASSGYYHCNDDTKCPEKAHEDYLVSDKTKMSNLLDNASASYEGVLLRFTKKGTYNYMCTRNNNFTNRSQKGAVMVS